MKRVLLGCKTVEAELLPLLPPDVELRVLEQGLHRTPEGLRQSLQREIDTAGADEILLGYGLCGGGVSGLSSRDARLVVPRAADCITLLLGSRDRYLEEFHREPGTYWLSFGWIEHARDPYREYLRCREKWDEETACWVAAQLMDGYRRLALIDTGVCPLSSLRPYARQFAEFFHLSYHEMAGSDALLRALLEPTQGDERFVVVEPGQEIRSDMFLPPLGTVNS